LTTHQVFDTLKNMEIRSKEEIIKYILFEKESRRHRELYNGSIKPKTPNLSEDASESLACHLIRDGCILKQLHPITIVERLGKQGKDILVNKYHKIEVKGTSSIEGCVTPSDSNFEAFAWIWLDFKPFFNSGNHIIDVHVITNPKSCVTSVRHVEAINENKLGLKSAICDARRTRNYEQLSFNLKTMLPLEDISKLYFS
jgi:hypothetical protein